MSEPPAHDLAVLRQLNDGGYGFYRDTARIRIDDLFVRSQAADALQRAMTALCATENSARAALPAPSRTQPFADPAALAALRTMRAMADRIARLETRLRGAAALPDRDFSNIIPSETVRQDLVACDASVLACASAVERSLAAADVLALEDALAAREAVGRHR